MYNQLLLTYMERKIIPTFKTQREIKGIFSDKMTISPICLIQEKRSLAVYIVLEMSVIFPQTHSSWKRHYANSRNRFQPWVLSKKQSH